jgi:hypothetical protein
MKKDSNIKMIITNKRGFKTNTKIYSSFLGHFKGLMFTKPLKQNHSILLKFKKEKNQPIHMLFVFFPIDAVWIDSSNKIVHIQRNIKPFTLLVNPKKKAISILETRKNATKQLKTGDRLQTTNTL